MGGRRETQKDIWAAGGEQRVALAQAGVQAQARARTVPWLQPCTVAGRGKLVKSMTELTLASIWVALRGPGKE